MLRCLLGWVGVFLWSVRCGLWPRRAPSLFLIPTINTRTHARPHARTPPQHQNHNQVVALEAERGQRGEWGFKALRQCVQLLFARGRHEVRSSICCCIIHILYVYIYVYVYVCICVCVCVYIHAGTWRVNGWGPELLFCAGSARGAYGVGAMCWGCCRGRGWMDGRIRGNGRSFSTP